MFISVLFLVRVLLVCRFGGMLLFDYFKFIVFFCFMIVGLICFVSDFFKQVLHNDINKIWSSLKYITGKIFIVWFFAL